jgi:DNA-binding transcriptional ArsR family regulator
MNHEGIAEIGALVGDETRARTLVALMDGFALPAGELARLSNVSAGTISSHLSKLVDGGLLKVEAQGKHRYYRLAGPKVATLIESFGTLVQLPKVSSPNPRVPGSLQYARTCYRHLAGYVAVELNKVAIEKGYWVRSALADKRYDVTAKGEVWLSSIGIEALPGRGGKGFARECLDWSERRHHLAGELGSFLLDRFLALKWIARIEGKRSVRITHRGQEELRHHFGMVLGS